MKPNRISRICLFTLALAGALTSGHTDVSPMMVGNVWNYQGSVYSYGYYLGPESYRVTERLKVEVISRTIPVEGVTYTVRFTDTLRGRVRVSRPNGESVLLADTVVTWTHTLLEKGDTLLYPKVGGWEAMINNGIPYPVMMSLVYNAFFRKHSVPHGTATEIAEATRKAWKNGIRDYPISGAENVEGWYVDDVGMFWTRAKGGGGCDGYIERELHLTAFNGAPVSIGIEPATPLEALVKEARSACGIRRLAAMRGMVRHGGGRSDLLGRSEAEVPWRN